MPTITAILPSLRPEGRFVIEVDGAAAATVLLETVERLGLRTGGEFDPVRADVERDAAALRTYDRALNLLAVRGRAVRDLRRTLLRKGEPADLVELAIARLLHLGLLDDAAYARSVARAKLVGQGYGRRRVQQELFQRGVDRTVAGEAIAETLEDEAVDEDATVERVARKKARTLSSLDPATRHRRLYAYLARRGFDADAIRRALRLVAGEEPDADVGAE